MALATNREKNDSILVAADTAVTQVTVGDVTAGHVEQQVVTVKSIGGKPVHISDAMYTRTNFYIRCTREYIPSRKLRVFVNFRWFFWIMTTVLCTQFTFLLLPSCLLGLLEPTGGGSLACLVLSLFTILSLIPTFIVFCQHLHVVCWTIPWVLRQPVIPKMTKDNDHLEIAVTSLEGVYLRAHNSGIGLVSQTTGKIKFQVLSCHAFWKIQWARSVSIFLAGMTFLFVIWAISVFIVSLIWLITQLNSVHN